jgi:hypothetical protein
MMQTEIRTAPYLEIVPARGVTSLDHHEDRAAKLIVDLLNLWKLSLTEEMPADSVARVGLNMVMANMRMVELRTLARIQEEPRIQQAAG